MNIFGNCSEVKYSYIKKVSLKDSIQITNSTQIYDLLMSQKVVTDTIDYNESFYCIYLNRANIVLNIERISHGGTAGTVADPKIIFAKALVRAASTIILAHNHPSGNIRPSEQDIQLTKKLRDGGTLLDLPILDHLIITSEEYYSFADEGAI